MLQYLNNSIQLKAITITAVAISLAACSPGGESATNSTNPASTPSLESPNNSASPASSSSAQQSTSSSNVSIPGVNDVSEITFIPVNQQNPASGGFEAVNESSATNHEVRSSAPIVASGWAALGGESRPADLVIVTSGENNSVVAVAPVNIAREDVAKALKNPAFKNSGWRTTIQASALPADRGVLKAWAYNSATKQARQLGNTHEVVVINQ